MTIQEMQLRIRKAKARAKMVDVAIRTIPPELRDQVLEAMAEMKKFGNLSTHR